MLVYSTKCLFWQTTHKFFSFHDYYCFSVLSKSTSYYCCDAMFFMGGFLKLVIQFESQFVQKKLSNAID